MRNGLGWPEFFPGLFRQIHEGFAAIEFATSAASERVSEPRMQTVVIAIELKPSSFVFVAINDKSFQIASVWAPMMEKLEVFVLKVERAEFSDGFQCLLRIDSSFTDRDRHSGNIVIALQFCHEPRRTKNPR